LRAATDGKVNGYELVDAPKLQAFLRQVFQGQKFEILYAAARRIVGGDKTDWQQPLDLHLDSQVHRFPFTVNFWVPFDDTGVEAPGMQLVPLDYRATRTYAGFVGKRLREDGEMNYGYFTPGVCDVAAVSAAFGPNCYLRPAINAGDLIV